MNMREILQRREAARKELRQIHESSPDGLSAEAQARWTELEAVVAQLDAAETRQAMLDDADRKAGGIPLTGDNPPPLPEGRAYAYTLETRMSDLAARETGLPVLPAGAFGHAVRELVTGKKSEVSQLALRAMGESTGVGGGFTLGAPVSATIFDLLRPSLVMGRAGVLTVPMELPSLGLVQVVGDPTSALRAENTTINESTGVFNQVTLRASSVAAKVRVSLELIEDNSAFISEIEHQITESMQHQIDFLCLSGVNTGLGPMGLRNTAGQQFVSMGTDGAVFTTACPTSIGGGSWDNIMTVMQAIEDNNGVAKTLIWNPRQKYSAAIVKDGLGQYYSTALLPKPIQDLQFLASNQVATDETQGSSSNASTAYIGDFSNCVLGLRKNITLDVTREGDSAFQNAQVVIRATARFDFAVIRPYALGQLNGLTG